MRWLSALNSRLSRWAMLLACACLVGLLTVVVYGVVMRYAFSDSPPYVEQLALLLVISVSMFGAAAGVRDAAHIGMDSLVTMLSGRVQFWCLVSVNCLSIVFGAALLVGGLRMAASTGASTIPTLGISEAFRYAPIVLGGLLIALFSFEHIVAKFTGKKVTSSWH